MMMSLPQPEMTMTMPRPSPPLVPLPPLPAAPPSAPAAVPLPKSSGLKLPAFVLKAVIMAALPDRASIGTAMRLLADWGLGGAEMRWLATQIIVKSSLKDQQIEGIYEPIKEYVLKGWWKEAAEWAKLIKEALQA